MSKQRSPVLIKNDIPSLKRLAKAIKRKQGISHSEALDQVACQYGYNAWSHLQSKMSGTPEKKGPEALLHEYFDGHREHRHLKMVAVLWEHLGQTPLVNLLLAKLSNDDFAIAETHLAHNSKLSNGFHDDMVNARLECMQADIEDDEREQALADIDIEKQIDEWTAHHKLKDDLDCLLGQFPAHTQITITTYRFSVDGSDDLQSLGSLPSSPRLYSTLPERTEYAFQRRIENALQSIAMIYDCSHYGSHFDSPEALDSWLTAPFDPTHKEGLCPLDALWNDDAFEYLRAYAAKIDEDTAQDQAEVAINQWINRWMKEPDSIRPEDRHLLKSWDTAKENFDTLRESASYVILKKLDMPTQDVIGGQIHEH